MNKIILTFIILFSSAQAQRGVNVIYPKLNQQIALVDSTFILGNVPPGSKLTINGIAVPVYETGGWLAYLDVSPGTFVFHIIAQNGEQIDSLDWPIVVGALQASLPESGLIPEAPNPSTKSIYFVGDILEFSYAAPSGGQGGFCIDGGDTIPMFSEKAKEERPESVFGPISISADTSIQKYVGYYRFAPGDTGLHSICYEYANPVLTTVISQTNQFSCLDTILTVMPALPPLFGILKGTNNIIRTAPQMGYKLLYQPPGITVKITGRRGNFYKLALAPGVSGFLPVDSVTILPHGGAAREGIVSFIQVDSIEGGAAISVDLGARIPYEIEESLDPAGIVIDFYGATGDVDWIRYNNKSPLVKIVKWSQPQDHIFRLSVEIAERKLWGYKASYDGAKFTLKLKGKPKSELRGLKIVIDPGHSQDPGAVGPTGLQEADANLWIAYKLRTLLEKKGAKVLMTRGGHENVSLYERPRKAEVYDADLLISIHNNALPDGINPFYNHGTSVYYYFPHSLGLAESVHKEMLKATHLPDYGVYFGNLVLTRYSAAPSILVECAFMIMPEQEAWLKEKKFQEACAKAILKGIRNFVKSK